MVSQFMVNHLDSDLESLYSEQSHADENTVFALEDYSVENSSSSDSDESSHNHFPIFMSKHTNSSHLCLQNTEASPQSILFTKDSQPPHI
jgi:hypothetical protein